MKKIFFFLLICTQILGQISPKLKGQTSSIDIKGSSNIIKVIQGETIKVYNLDNNVEFKTFLDRFPKITTQLKDVLSYSKQTIDLVSKLVSMNQEYGILNTEKFLEKFTEKVEEVAKIKIELSILRKQTKNEELIQVLEEANNFLDIFDNEGYQKTLEQFKQNKVSKIQQELIEMAQVSYLQAKNSKQNSKLELALKQINDALEFDNNNIQYLQELGLIQMDRNSFEESYKCFDKVLSYDIPNEIVSQTYDYLGLLYFKQGHYDKSIAFFQKAMDFREMSSIVDNNFPASSYNSLGTVYFMVKNYDKAIENFQKSLMLIKEEYYYTPSTYNSLALAYEMKGDIDKANEYCLKSVEICERIYGKEHLETATSYNNMGLSYEGKGDFDKSLDYFFKALVIREKIHGKQHVETAVIYSNIGHIYEKKKIFDKALDFCKKNVLITEVLLGKKDVLVANAYHDLGKIYYSMNDYDDATIFFQKSVDIQESIFEKGHLSIFQYYFDLGLGYLAKGEKEKGLLYLNQSFFAKESNHVKAEILNAVGVEEFQKGQFKISVNFYSLSLDFLERNQKNLPDNLWVVLHQNLASAYCLYDDKKIALSLFERAINASKQLSLDMTEIIKNYEDCKNR